LIINLKNIIEYNLSSEQKLIEEEEKGDEGDLHQDQVGDEVDHTYQWGLTTAPRTRTNDVIVQVTSTFVNLKFHSFIEINYLKIIYYCLFFNRLGKKNKLTCCGWASTKQCTSKCIDHV